MRRRVIGLAVAILVVLAGVWLLMRLVGGNGRSATSISASGTIEATEVLVSARIPGRVLEVYVREGDRVRKGQLVARLDTAELEAQVGQAEASYETALARLDAARNGPRTEEIAAARAALDQARAAEAGARDNLAHAERAYRRVTELRAAYDAARMRVRAAEAQLAEAQEALRLVRAGARPQQIDQARAAVEQARAALAQAEADVRRTEELYRDGAVSAHQRDIVLTTRDTARARLAEAAAALENLLAGARTEEVRQAELAVTQAQANLDAARLAEEAARETLADRLAAITALDTARTALHSARAQVRSAQARLDLLLAGTRTEEIRAAVKQVEQAREALRLARVQRGHAQIAAPTDGVVKTKVVEGGEVVAAGAPIVVLLDASRPWLRVYIPEARYGAIRLGDRANVTVDSFPGEVFHGRVIEIASEAEFTPKNVQSPEERLKLVFGVKIDLTGSGEKLRPGMPADAVLLPSGTGDTAQRRGR